ncbi:MAG: glycine cleavage system protein [Desulfovibrionales bacterium]|nr:glycine cleavage system protein [Desulfovibrionales bacterium]
MIPENLLYSASHEWLSLEDGVGTVGITHFAQEQLGDLTFVELPEIGRTVEAGEEIGALESVKAASEIYAPIAGEVVEVNPELENAPELVNEDPYGKGWMFKIKASAEPEELMDAAAYAERIAEEAH